MFVAINILERNQHFILVDSHCISDIESFEERLHCVHKVALWGQDALEKTA